MLRALFERTTRYRWNEGAGRYIGSRGRFVSGSAVRGALDEFVDGQATAMGNLTGMLRDGSISLADWQRAMMEQVKQTHLASVAAQRGGWAQLTQADYGRAGQRIRQQYEYLRNFAQEIADGTQPLDGRAVQRTRLYGQAGRNTYHLSERTDMERRGFDEERNILDPAAKHCQSCIDETARGWVSLGALVPIGERTCNMNDRCSVEYRNSATCETR